MGKYIIKVLIAVIIGMFGFLVVAGLMLKGCASSMGGVP